MMSEFHKFFLSPPSVFLGLSPFWNALLEPRGQAAHVGGLGVGPEGLQR